MVVLPFVPLLFGQLENLVTKVDKGNAQGVGTTLHYHENHITKFVVIVKDVYRIRINIHSACVFELLGHKLNKKSRFSNATPEK